MRGTLGRFDAQAGIASGLQYGRIDSPPIPPAASDMSALHSVIGNAGHETGTPRAPTRTPIVTILSVTAKVRVVRRAETSPG